MKGKRRTVKDKILIVLEFYETDIKVAGLCRKHNITPGAFSKWKSRFVEGRKRRIESGGASELVLCRRKIDKLKAIIVKWASD